MNVNKAKAPDVVLARCPSYDPADCRAALEQVVEAFGGLDWVRPGMRIGIKANLVAGMKPDAAATTHPVLIRNTFDILALRYMTTCTSKHSTNNRTMAIDG